MISRMYLKLPDPERDHFQGTIDAPIALLEYGDYECPFCGELQPIVKEIQRRGREIPSTFRCREPSDLHRPGSNLPGKTPTRPADHEIHSS